MDVEERLIMYMYSLLPFSIGPNIAKIVFLVKVKNQKYVKKDLFHTPLNVFLYTSMIIGVKFYFIKIFEKLKVLKKR